MVLDHLSDDNPLHAVKSSLASKGYPEEANLLLDTLFGGFTNCFIEVRLIKGESVLQFFYPSISAIQWGLIKGKNSAGYNCYFGVCLRKTQKGDKSSVASISALWGDLDGKNFAGGKPEALAQLQQLPPYLYPSIILDTGHGYHPYWLLREAEPIESPQEILRLEAYMKGLALTLHGDATSDLSRVLRLPGLVNRKDAKNPCLCHIVHFEPERRFTPMDFDDYQEEIREAPENKPRAKEAKRQRSDEFNTLAIEKLLENCSFMQLCQAEAETLSEPYWWSMVHILAVFGNPGRDKIHELSAPYRGYTERETEQKIKEALKAGEKEIGPHTCAHIEKTLGFSCPAACLAKKWRLKSPVVLANRLARFGGLPMIIVSNRFLKEKTADTIAAVEQANQPPRIFERSGSIARVAHDEYGIPYIEVVTENACRGFIERAAAYVSVDKNGRAAPAAAPPLDVVRDFMSLPTRNLPALLNVTEIPILRSNGSILTEQGYDQASRLYYEPAAVLRIPAVPNNPSKKELSAAIALIQEPLLDFPFDSEASKTNALALLLTPVCRPMIDGLVPLCLLDKPAPGTGAGLLADVIALIATGRQATMMAPPRSDEECEKRIGSFLLSGQTILIIDNVEGYLYFASLAMLLTAPTYLTRILGQSKTVRLPNRGTYIVTGNNIKLGGDMARRCYLSRMDAREALPWMRDRESFKYTNLIQWVKENRGRLLVAILTMARAWVVAGRPAPKGLLTLGGYEDWVNTLGGILAYAGLPDFLGNLEFMYQQADVETPQWEGFLSAWQEVFGSEPTLIDTIVKSLGENETITAAFPDRIDREPKKINRSLGNALRHRAGMRYPNGLMVIKCDYKVHHAVPWQVVNYREAPEKGGVRGVSGKNSVSYKSDRQRELGELVSYPDSVSNNEGVEKKKEIYKNGLEHNSPNSPQAQKRGVSTENITEDHDLWAGMPDYPHEPCHACGGSDFWPDFKNKRFVCGLCHPQPREIDMEV